MGGLNSSQIKSIIILVLIIIVVPFFDITLRGTMLNNAEVVRINQSSGLQGEINASLFGNSQKNSISTDTSKIVISNIKYFDEGKWVIVVIKILPNSGSSLLILRSIGSVYVVAFGPGTSIPQSATVTLPVDLTNYLELNKMVDQND